MEITTHTALGVDKTKRYGWVTKDEPGSLQMLHKDVLQVHPAYQRDVLPVSEDQKDAERLNYLQEHGATVHLVSTTNSNLLSFVIGGLHRSKRLNLREAIDAAMYGEVK